MPYYKFGKNDLFYNRLKTYPSVNLYMYDEVVIYNNDTQYTGDLSGVNIKNVPPGNISLYELNIDRPREPTYFSFYN